MTLHRGDTRPIGRSNGVRLSPAAYSRQRHHAVLLANQHGLREAGSYDLVSNVACLSTHSSRGESLTRPPAGNQCKTDRTQAIPRRPSPSPPRVGGRSTMPIDARSPSVREGLRATPACGWMRCTAIAPPYPESRPTPPRCAALHGTARGDARRARGRRCCVPKRCRGRCGRGLTGPRRRVWSGCWSTLMSTEVTVLTFSVMSRSAAASAHW